MYRLDKLQKTLEMIVMAALLGAHGCRVSITDWLAGVRINGPVVLVTEYPGKHHEKIVEGGIKTKQYINCNNHMFYFTKSIISVKQISIKQ